MHVRAQFVTKPSVALLDLGSEIKNPLMTFDLEGIYLDLYRPPTQKTPWVLPF